MRISKAVFYFLVGSLAIMNASCESSRRTTRLKEEYKEIYLDQFKLTYVRKLLLKSYNNSNAIQEIIGGDYSGFTEPILTQEDYNLIDSLTSIDNQFLMADSAIGKETRAEGAHGKRPIGYMMGKISGKWLDSLANRRLKLNGIPKYWYE